MLLKDKKIIFGLTSSQYAFEKTIPQILRLTKEGAEVIPVMSYDAYNVDSKFGKAKEFIKKIEEITSKKVIHTNEEADNFNDFNEIDLMEICPCSGNTIGKLAIGIMDTPVLKMARKILRSDKCIVLGIATADGLAGNAENIGKLLNRKNIFFVPFRQDNPITKPRSLSFEPKYIYDTTTYALNKEQIQPILL